ncbi:PREDICTED: uncharacterized protein LOC105120868 isoform X2 [Populus euphratica]|uniref:Uncharacterized protein LOC105120868 isoform X2 n=1 Tax=Populus euphratica TaxID=75702 RepID=A0AAJ6TV02_POPEU|nr:PREDICTED: uncharacterized protein LOC105120868 isoform X2 [Populus euphratica]
MMIHIIRRGSARSTISTVFDEVANAIHGANMQWRARSYAASVPSHMPKSHKAQKRVSKDDRRAMVESYVNKYRETHAGKFPSISDAQKEAGGNYYFIRKIVQELEYKSKLSSLNSGNKKKELPIMSEPLVKVKNMSTGGAISDMRNQCDPRAVPLNDVGDTSYRYLEVEGGLQTCEKVVSQEFGNPISPEHSDTVGTQGKLLERIDKEAFHCPEKSVEHEVMETQNDHSDFVITNGNSHFLLDNFLPIFCSFYYFFSHLFPPNLSCLFAFSVSFTMNLFENCLG